VFDTAGRKDSKIVKWLDVYRQYYGETTLNWMVLRKNELIHETRKKWWGQGSSI